MFYNDIPGAVNRIFRCFIRLDLPEHGACYTSLALNYGVICWNHGNLYAREMNRPSRVSTLIRSPDSR